MAEPENVPPEQAGTMGSDWSARGVSLAELLLTWELWAHRKFETIEFVDEQVARRLVTVQFVLPDLPGSLVAAGRPHHFLPLARLEKRTLTNFDLVLDGGEAVPMLSRQEHKELVTAALVAVVEAELEASLPPRDPLLDRCRAVVTSPPKTAMAPLREFEDDDRFPDGGEVMRLVRVLAYEFVVIAVLAAEPGRRRTATFSYDEWIGDPALTAWENVRTGAGWQSKPVWFRVAMGNVKSYHLQIDSPVGLQLTRRYLVTSDLPRRIPVGPYRRVRFYHEPGRETAHGYAVVHLRPLPSTIVRGAAATALLGVGVMAALAIAALSGGFPKNSGSAPALLLVVPGVLSVLLVRPGEHPMTTDMLFAMRALTLVPGILAFAGATVFAGVGHGSQGVGVALLCLAVATAVVAGTLTRAWMACRRRPLRRIEESYAAHRFLD